MLPLSVVPLRPLGCPTPTARDIPRIRGPAQTASSSSQDRAERGAPSGLPLQRWQRSSMTGSSHSPACAPRLRVRLSLSFPWRLQLQASRVWGAGRRQGKRLKSRVEKERWELLAERQAVAQRKGRTQPGQGVTSEVRPKEMVLGEKRWQRLAREEGTKRKVKLERPKL